VVLEKSINERMASTVRHNRARGKHSIQGMGNLVFEMLRNGATDTEVCAQLGLEAEELIRLKHVSGYAKLFANLEYGRAWETHVMMQERANWKATNREERGDYDGG
jgi:hypothetical protein